MIVLGIILLIVGAILALPLLYYIGGILLLIGIVIVLFGFAGHGARHGLF